MNAPGDVVDGRFELIERLGSGGMGTVWRARDTVLHREVALKAVRPDAEASAAVRERVLREARALARLNNPHVVTIHQIIDADPDAHPWLVMELVPGVSLQQRLSEGPLAPAAAARTGLQLLSALRAAHAAGVQHRDVKPANVLLRPDGTAVLTDFGIAALQGATALTVTGELVGSPEYMAPERIRGTDDDPASDLWSLGLVLYVCVEGVSPLRRATTLATLAAVLDDPVPPPVRSGPLTPVLQALLVRDPAARPDAERLNAMLAQVESGATPEWAQPTVTATPSPVPPQPDVPPPGLPGPGAAPGTPPAAGAWPGLGPGPGPGPGPVPRPGPASPSASASAPTRTPAPEPGLGPERRSRTPFPVIVAAVAVLAVIVAVVVTLAVRDGEGGQQAGGGAGSHAATSTPKSTPSRTPGTRPPTGPSEPPPSAPDAGRWIAQLHSEPVGSGTAARDQRLATIRESVPEALFVRSDDYASLRPGYWVIYAPGPFTDGRAALTFCAERGRTTANSCIGRYLSTSSADYGFQCRPPVSSPTGRCTRDRSE
ncbi:serine/threonine protein kinase [Streptomyces sp. KM273126]|uniref:serine/threonine-protein kinase n=1 Tax=Streptomyces sp. KM273126 TaxID=2545247 RepID=UPI00103DE10D|nr:serine/threonine-protein kinase [Streptomyces sp. KM273126]MBA2805949.1 serine/threonine protein kinase [Streptomyces sp. KM273126]